MKIAYLEFIMIYKINPKNIFTTKTFNPSISLNNAEASDFYSLMKEKLGISTSLENSFIELLKQTVEIILHQALIEKNKETSHMSNNLQACHDFEPIVLEASRKYGVDSALINAVIKVESQGDPMAVSQAGAQGLMQLMPGTAADLNVTNPFDPVQNIMGGTRYLRQLLDRYQGNVRLALSAYNWGMGNLERRPDALPKETQNYIAKVENLLSNA